MAKVSKAKAKFNDMMGSARFMATLVRSCRHGDSSSSSSSSGVLRWAMDQNSEWDARGYNGDILPICAVISSTDEDKQRWNTVSVKNGFKITKTKPAKFEVNAPSG